MSAKLNIFITGATGYIGGCHANAASFEITALVRSAEKAEKLHTLGTDCDNLPAAQAILDGQKLRHEKSGKVPILIHTVSIIMDDARGLHGDHKTYSDLESEALNALPVTALHRNVDIPIVEADKAGYVKSYIVTPGTVFGYPSGPLVDLKVQNIHSIQLPYTIKPSLARKQGGYIGKGLHTWSAVDVEDTADLFLVIFNAALAESSTAGHGTEGYYFAENFVYSGLDVAQGISEALVDLGIATTREPSAFSQEELDTFYGGLWPFLATNSHAKGDRGRALGWAPKHGKADFLANLKAEVGFYVKNA
ncbi:hypothetical protein BJ912DRAFT_986289 [Pholiota molesta]|nr:hypothetical protein BJ912DRAFT_986289 [Pholiota molesta]